MIASDRRGKPIRRRLGIAVFAGAAVIALGLAAGMFARAGGEALDQLGLAPSPAAASGSNGTMFAQNQRTESNLPVLGGMPSFDGAAGWLNSKPLALDQLRGKVVLVDFWTYSCINCIRTIPYVRAWAEKYKDQGLVIVGVHTPEFAFEKKVGNIEAAAKRFDINYPIVIDSDYRVWRAFGNSYWPAFYFIDGQGRVRYRQFGEGDYGKAEVVIQELLADAGKRVSAGGLVVANADGAEAAPDLGSIRSDETYIGYREGSNFASNEWSAGTPRRTIRYRSSR
jgi:thiol-disulfide isomerase/thioredoxin